MSKNYITIDDARYPAHWEICPHCQGNGSSSAYLGAFSREEFDHEFSYEEQEAYFNGEYDRPCEECEGQGKRLVLNEDELTDEQREELQSYYDYKAELRYEKQLRERGIQW